MKVLHVVPVSLDGTRPIFIEHQLNSLLNEGITGFVVEISGRSIGWNLFEWFKAKKLIESKIREFEPDIVHAHWGSLLSLLTVFSLNSHSKFVLTFRGSDLNRVPSEKFSGWILRRSVSKFSSTQADKVICVSTQLKDQLKICDSKIEVIPDGTDTEVFFPRDKLEARRFLGWDSEEKVVFFYEGNRPGPKGRETVDAVMEELRKDSENFRLQVVQMGYSQHQLSIMLAASDCMIFTSLSEGSPNIVREAISCGCPVVTVRVGDVEMWISDSTIGKVVNRDPVQLSESVKDMIEKSAKSKALTQIPDLAQTASRINLVYESIVG